MLKKIISIALSLVLVLSLTAVYTASAEEAAPEGTYEVLTSGGNLVMRSAPNYESCCVIAHIPNGTQLCITEIENGYGKTTYKGVDGEFIGWVSMDYLRHIGEVDPLRLVCLTEETYKQIKAMKETDELQLTVHLKEPTSETGYISCAELGLSAEEFEQLKIDRYKLNDLVCEVFINDYSLEKAMIGRPMPNFSCKLTLDDINKIIKDERFDGFMYWKSEDATADCVNNAFVTVDGEIALELNRLIDGYELYLAGSPYNGEDAELRSYPINSFNVIDHIPNGTVLQITEFSNGFGRTTYNGKQGWVISGYLQRYEAATDTDESYTVPEILKNNLVLRAGPGRGYSMVTLIPAGTLLHITETANGYGKTVYNGGEGWVVMDILRNPDAYSFLAAEHNSNGDTDEEVWDLCLDDEVAASIRGDANEDGNLDMLDVTVAQKSIAKYDTHCNALLADMDDNGKVDLEDVTAMQKEIAKF